MNKKFLSAILFGALAIASTGSFVSCADNDSDIAALQDQNSELKAQLASLKTQLQAELKGAASEAAAAAVEAKLSTLDAATPENMAATLAALQGDFKTTEAKVIALQTQIKALEGLQNVDVTELISVLEKAKDNAASANIGDLAKLVEQLDAQVVTMVSEIRSIVFQPQFYVDGIEAVEYTYLKYVALDPKGDAYDDTKVTEAWSNEASSYNEEHPEGGSESFFTPRTNKKFHIGEGKITGLDKEFAWRYAHIGDISWGVTPNWTESSLGHGDWCKHYATLSNCPDDGCMYGDGQWGWYVALPKGVYDYVGKDILNEMYFAVNPANAAVSKEDLAVAVKNVCAMTRATADVTIVDAVKTDGILKVTYYISNPKDIITANNDESYSALNKQENTTIFKLQFTDSDKDGVESDWAALYETSIQPIAIALNEHGATKHSDVYPAWYAPINCAADGKKVYNELHKNPYEAAADMYRTAEIAWDSEGVDIAKHIELHFLKRDLEKMDRKHKNEQNLANNNNNSPEIQHPHVTMSLAEAAYRYGFEYEFNLVPYVIDDNETNNSSYGHLKAGLYNNSIFVPNTVDEERATVAGDKFAYIPKKAMDTSKKQKDGYEQGASSVDKEPLVQVLVKKNGEVILDGYVSFIITREVENVVAPIFDLGIKEKDCKALGYKSTYNQYSELILEHTAERMLGMSKLEFEEGYELYTYDPNNYPAAAVQFDVQFTADGKVTSATPIEYKNTYTNIYQDFDPNGITNNTLNMSLDKFDQEYVFEKKASEVFALDIYTHTVKKYAVPEHSNIIWVMYVRRGTTSHTENLHGILVPIELGVKKSVELTYGRINENFWYSDLGSTEVREDKAVRYNVNHAVDNANSYQYRYVGNDILPEQFTHDPAACLDGNAGVTEEVEGFVRDLNDAWDAKSLNFKKGNDLVYGSASKSKPVYYFHPANRGYEFTSENNGKTYVLDIQYVNVECDIWVMGDDPEVTTGVNKHSHTAIADAAAAYKVNPDTIKNTEKYCQVNTLAGIYKNVYLYCQEKGKPETKEIIAEMNRYTGAVHYRYNEMSKLALNAKGHHEAELKVKIGLFLPDGCENAYFINYDYLAHNDYPMFYFRPIDIYEKNDTVIDAVNNASYVNVWKNFDFEDWRDYKFIDESKANKYENIWLTAFYGLHTIRVDFANATTDMNKHDITKDKLVDVNKDIKLSFVDHSKTTIICDNDAETPEPLVNTLTNDLRLSGYNKASKGVKSTYDYITEHFGYIKYMNKGANVSKFHVHIPVTFIYDWGEITRKVCITVIGTEGNNTGEDDPDYDDSIHQGTHIVKK